jgi:hypothetical protein
MNEPSDSTEYAHVKIANIELPIQSTENFEIQSSIDQNPNEQLKFSNLRGPFANWQIIADSRQILK